MGNIIDITDLLKERKKVIRLNNKPADILEFKKKDSLENKNSYDCLLVFSRDLLDYKSFLDSVSILENSSEHKTSFIGYPYSLDKVVENNFSKPSKNQKAFILYRGSFFRELDFRMISDELDMLCPLNKCNFKFYVKKNYCCFYPMKKTKFHTVYSEFDNIEKAIYEYNKFLKNYKKQVYDDIDNDPELKKFYSSRLRNSLGIKVLVTGIEINNLVPHFFNLVLYPNFFNLPKIIH